MPREWMHAQDELYHGMRGPIENITLLATAYSDKSKGGTGDHEPMIWTVSYGKGRIFHTCMGHDLKGMSCVGFVATLQRGTEWAATNQVTIPLPKDFPTEKEVKTITSP
jgi:type 1 glutamine amidotransferase